MGNDSFTVVVGSGVNGIITGLVKASTFGRTSLGQMTLPRVAPTILATDVQFP